MEIERCPTGIQGLDELTEGGFPRGRVILLAGGCGTGKSIFATQFLYNGVVKYDEPGILLTLEQNPELLRTDMNLMGFDLEKLEDENRLVIIDASLSGIVYPKKKRRYTISQTSSFSLDSILGLISEATNQIGAKRAVVDSFSALDSLIETRKSYTGAGIRDDVRRAILGINYKLQSMNLTSLLISDVLGDGTISKYGIEEFMVDGVITLHYNVAGPDAGRHLIIRKMRSTKHNENINSIELVKGDGMRVKGF
jgi:KaiC/GvpD/RAD55 family RecA-like ATPase